MSALGTEEAPGGKLIEKYDLSGDKKADLWKVFQIVAATKEGESEQRILIRKKMDLNFDGKVDVVQFMRKNGEIYREEMDLDFDGIIDAVAFYKKGELVRRELDLTFDGRADIIKYYEDGKLVRKERDANRDGRIDIWEYFESGRIVRVGHDRDGDGKPEYFDEAPEPDPEIPGGAPSN
jgi:antitoxin component YwqK of YwqJK toxin-antitoxin module